MTEVKKVSKNKKNIAFLAAFLYNSATNTGGAIMTETQCRFLIAVFLLLGASAPIFALARGAEPARKRLCWSLFLLGGMILLRFGGNYVLSKLDMGWRLTPRYTMNFLIWVLFLVTIARCVQTFVSLPDKNLSPVWVVSCLSLFPAAILVTILIIGLSQDRLYESVATIDGQTVVRESKMNGGAVRRFYLPVNLLVHGQELEYDWRTDTVTLPDGRAVSIY